MIVGIDVGSQVHFARVFDWRNFEYSKKPFAFSNDEEGFMAFKNWMDEIAEKHDKEVVLPGMEPTGHYWFGLGMFLQNLGMRPVHVNSHHVKKSKGLDDNNPNKNDRIRSEDNCCAGKRRKIFLPVYSIRNLCGNKKSFKFKIPDTGRDYSNQESNCTLVQHLLSGI